MYADTPKTMRCHWLCRWLVCALLMLVCVSAWGETYLARDESLHTFFTALSVPLGVPIVVSQLIDGKVWDGSDPTGYARSFRLHAMAEHASRQALR